MLLLLSLGACREPFVPVIAASNENLLVVEGNINTRGVSRIALSRSTNYSQTAGLKPELKATVKIEGSDNSVSMLTDSSGTGNYASPAQLLNTSFKYRLHVYCSSGEEYLTEYAVPIVTPPIDSVNWKFDATGVHVFANTHDPLNKTHFYLYTDTETWQFNSIAFSTLVYQGDTLAPRSAALIPQLYYCWVTASSTDVKITSTARLSADKVYEFPIKDIAGTDERLAVRYSILVRQFAQSADSYAFFQLLKTNSETTGSIFSQQPSTIRGNIHSPDGKKFAIGFINVSNESDARIFITHDQVPNTIYSRYCPIKKVPPDSLKYFFPDLLPLYADYAGSRITDYPATIPSCADCRFHGSPVKPTFW